MSDDLWDWADLAAISAMADRPDSELVRLFAEEEPLWIIEEARVKYAAAIREAYEDGKRYQRSKDVAICKALSRTLDPCHDVSNAADCQRAIENRLSPEEAARRVRNGESLDE